MILDIISGLDKIPETDIVEGGKEEVRPDEKVVGTVGLRARRLFTAITRQADLIGAKEQTPVNTLQEFLAKRKEIEVSLKRAELLQGMFWQDIREEFNLDGQDISIRKGWVVVADEPNSITDDLLINLADIIPPCNNPNCPIHGHRESVVN